MRPTSSIRCMKLPAPIACLTERATHEGWLALSLNKMIFCSLLPPPSMGVDEGMAGRMLCRFMRIASSQIHCMKYFTNNKWYENREN